MLCLEDVAIGYAGEKGCERVVARGISESLCRGEMACLIGSNGVGKSTLLRSICGLQPLLAGRVMVDGSDVALLSRRQRAGHVSIVLTSVDRDLSLSAAEVVALGRSPYTDFWGTLSASDRQIVEASMGMQARMPRCRHIVYSLKGTSGNFSLLFSFFSTKIRQNQQFSKGFGPRRTRMSKFYTALCLKI